jgi:hypothetical protein
MSFLQQPPRMQFAAENFSHSAPKRVHGHGVKWNVFPGCIGMRRHEIAKEDDSATHLQHEEQRRCGKLHLRSKLPLSPSSFCSSCNFQNLLNMESCSGGLSVNCVCKGTAKQ